MGIARVGIVGAGTMGSGIAVNLATHGKDVRLVDSSAAQLDKARDMARQHFARARWPHIGTSAYTGSVPPTDRPAQPRSARRALRMTARSTASWNTTSSR